MNSYLLSVFSSPDRWVTYIALVLLGVLTVLLILLFRKISYLQITLRGKDKDLLLLQSEVKIKENIQEKAFSAIGEMEEAVPRLRDLFVDACRSLNLKRSALVFRDTVTAAVNHFDYPDEALLPDKLQSWVDVNFVNDRQGSYLPRRLNGEDLKEFFRPESLMETLKGVAFPCFQRGLPVGGLLVLMENEDDLQRRINDLARMAEVFGAIVSYRTLQGEIAQSVEDANTVSAFLSRVVLLGDTEKLLDAIYSYCREQYSQANVTILVMDAEQRASAKKGALQEETLIMRLLPLATEDFRLGKHVLYFPEPASIIKKYNLADKPEHIQSLLIAPLMVFNDIFGFMVFESKRCNPFKINRLSSLIRLVEISSFLLRKNLFFQKELEKKQEDTDKYRQELTRQAVLLQERETTIRELSDFNSVFGMVQAVKAHLATLRGFLSLLDDSVKKTTGAAYDPVMFRNCQVEVDKMDRSVRKFELVRVVTEPDFAFRSVDRDAGDFLNGVFAGIRARALMKKVEMESKWDEGIRHLVVDPDLLHTAMVQFFERIMDFVYRGKIQNLVLFKEDHIQLLSKYTPAETENENTSAFLGESFRNDFNYVVLSRLIQRHGGRLEMDIQYEKGFVLRLTFPSTLGPMES